MIELLISIALISVMTVILTDRWTDLRDKSENDRITNTAHLFFHRLRSDAIRSGSTQSVILTANKLQASSGQLFSEIQLPRTMEGRINNLGRIGFNNEGHSAPSGTLSLTNKLEEKKITVGVGFGKVSIK